MTNATAIWNDRLVFLLGVNTGFVTRGEPDARYINFYRQRSSAHLHCAIIGNVVVPDGHGSNRSTPTIGAGPVWAEIATAIRQRGSLPGIQLATAWEGYQGERSFLSADGEQVIPRAQELVRSLGQSGIRKALDSFGLAA